MSDIRFRCSSLGLLMTEPKLKSEVLSVGAKTYIRKLAAESIFGVDFEVSSKQLEKGLLVEDESIALLNRVRGLSLVKNTERRTDDFITGEADLFNPATACGHDLKSSWSFATFPICETDCFDKVYEYQMRGYMRLWNADFWSVDYCLVNTPERLIGFEPITMHFVDHVPEHMRVTSWEISRDLAIEAAMIEKVKHARRYFAQVVATFHAEHSDEEIDEVSNALAAPPWDATSVPKAATAPFEALPTDLFA